MRDPISSPGAPTNEGPRVTKLKRRASAPIESLFMNHPPALFTASPRKRMRMSEPDDLSKAFSIANIPRNRVEFAAQYRNEPPSDTASSTVATEAMSSAGAVNSRANQTSRAVIATMHKQTKPGSAATTRARPHLSLQIPARALVQTVSPVGEEEVDQSQAERVTPISGEGDVLITLSSPDYDEVNDGPLVPAPQPIAPSLARVPTPLTPLAQLVRRPSNPPPVIVRHGRKHSEDAPVARRVERLFAPTPTETNFSANLNFCMGSEGVSTPISAVFIGDADHRRLSLGEGEVEDHNETENGPLSASLSTGTMVDGKESDDESDATVEGDDDHHTSTSPARIGTSTTPYPLTLSISAQPFQPLPFPILETLQPLASPYATHFPSPAPSSNFSTPKSSPIASYFPLIKTPLPTSTEQKNTRKSMPIKTTSSLPFPSLPMTPGSAGGSIGHGQQRPFIPNRRSSLGPGRSLSSSLAHSSKSPLSSPVGSTFPSSSALLSSSPEKAPLTWNSSPGIGGTDSSFGPHRRPAHGQQRRRNSLLSTAVSFSLSSERSKSPSSTTSPSDRGRDRDGKGKGAELARTKLRARPGLKAPRLSYSGVKGIPIEQLNEIEEAGH